MQGLTIAKRIGAKEYLECSALTGEGVREVFEHAARLSLLPIYQKPSKPCIFL